MPNFLIFNNYLNNINKKNQLYYNNNVIYINNITVIKKFLKNFIESICFYLLNKLFKKVKILDFNFKRFNKFLIKFLIRNTNKFI
jgi:hypothetical protein